MPSINTSKRDLELFHASVSSGLSDLLDEISKAMHDEIWDFALEELLDNDIREGVLAVIEDVLYDYKV